MIDVDKTIRELWETHGRHGQETAREAQAYESAREVLEALPDADSHWIGASGRIYLYLYRSKDDAREARSAVQNVLGIMAEREFNERTGTVAFVLKTPKMEVTITGGDVAPGCEIVAYEETVTKYRMDCGNGNDEEVVANLAAETGSPEVGVVESVSPDEESVTVRLDADEGGPEDEYALSEHEATGTPS